MARNKFAEFQSANQSEVVSQNKLTFSIYIFLANLIFPFYRTFQKYLEMKCQKLWPSKQANPWSVQHFGNEICPNISHQICERKRKNYTDIKLHFPRLDFLALNEVRPLRL